MELLHYVLSRNGIEISSEIVCRAHYESDLSMRTLTDRERRYGYKQTARPYIGDRACETCEASAIDHRTGASA